MRTALLPPPVKKAQADVSLAIVNIVLLLIFFFLATGQLLNPPTQGIDLSETSELPLDQLPSPILIVSSDGTWELDGTPVAPDLMGVALSGLEQPVILHVLIDRLAPATTLMDVVNRPELSQVEMKLVTLRKVDTP